MSNSNLVSVRVPASTNNYDVGRKNKIEKITIHHMAGVMSAQRCGELFQNPNRLTSSTYGIGNDGEIGLYVDEANTPWTDGNYSSNSRSVTIETSNSSTEGNWPVSDKALNSLIKLVADIAKRNNLGTLVKGKNVTWHRMYANTQCPGEYLLSKMDYIVDEANKINAGESKVDLEIEPIERKSVKLNKDANLWDLNFTSWGTAKSVKAYKKGDVIGNIVAIAKHPLGSKYYLTEYSYKNKINNGFNVVDCDDVPKEITYIVKDGDTLSSIAKEFETTSDKIATDNKLIYPGQKLIIK